MQLFSVQVVSLHQCRAIIARPVQGYHRLCLYIHATLAMQLQNHNSTELDMSGGSSSAKGFGRGSGKGGRKGPPIVWEDGPIVGPKFFSEVVYEFPVECKSDFTKDSPLRGYDYRREE